MRFFPQLKEDDIAAMTPQKVKYYVQAMEMIRARERLIMMDAALYPSLVEREKKKKHKEVYRAAYPEKFEKRVVKTTDLELI